MPTSEVNRPIHLPSNDEVRALAAHIGIDPSDLVGFSAPPRLEEVGQRWYGPTEGSKWAKDLARRFSRKVRLEGDCWLFTGARQRSGHGSFVANPPQKLRGAVSPVSFAAHRFAWEAWHQLEVPSGRIVMHLCANPDCVKPTHLTLSTLEERMRDVVNMGAKRRPPVRASLVARIAQLERQLSEAKAKLVHLDAGLPIGE